MAKIKTNSGENVFTIKKWLGVNEATEGDGTLKSGEAAVMRNFKVTSGGALQKRGGSLNVAELTQNYNIEISDDTVTETEFGKSTKSFTVYPRVTTDNTGSILPEGDSVNVTADNANDYIGYYSISDGSYREFQGLQINERQVVESRDYGFLGDSEYTGGDNIKWAWFCVYDGVLWNGESWELSGGNVVSLQNIEAFDGSKYMVVDEKGNPVSKFATNSEKPTEDYFLSYYNASGRFGKVAMNEDKEWYIDVGGTSDRVWAMYITVTEIKERSFNWNFKDINSSKNPYSDTVVKELWSGYVNGREVLCGAGNGHLWELTKTESGWEKSSCGAIDTSGSVHLFGFDEKLYILNGAEYKVWDGTVMTDVIGYRPLVTVSVAPDGGGTTLEQVNKLNGFRRCWVSPDGESSSFKLPESGISSIDWVKDLVTGKLLGGYVVDLTAGTVTFTDVPERGVNTIEIAWTHPVNYRNQVTAMRYSELFNGSQDTRVFIYGDGSNKAFYSGLDYDGNPRADYFPDLNECAVGDKNTPITAMIRHYNRLLCFKMDSAWSIYYDAITLTDGTVTAGFYVTPVNRDVGSCAYGEARLVENRPRTLDGRSVIEWRSTSSSGNITGDERNAQRISQRVDETIRSFDLTKARTFYDKITHEYYIIGENGRALVNNTEADVWYIYTDFDAKSMINYKDEVYYGTSDGHLRHFSRDYLSDNGEKIDAYWESGAMDFGNDFRRKYSANLWLSMKPETGGFLEITAETDRKREFAVYSAKVDGENKVPSAEKVHLKAKKFSYYKLILRNFADDRTVTVVGADLRIRSAGKVI